MYFFGKSISVTNPESTSEPNAVPAKPVQTREPESGLPYQQDFSLVRVLLTVLILSGIGAGGWYLLFRETTPPILVPYSGRVFYKGAAVSSGGILTEPFNKDLTGAVGAARCTGPVHLNDQWSAGGLLRTSQTGGFCDDRRESTHSDRSGYVSGLEIHATRD